MPDPSDSCDTSYGMKMDMDTAATLNALAGDLQAVAERPDHYELEPETHVALLSAVETLQQILMKLNYLES